MKAGAQEVHLETKGLGIGPIHKAVDDLEIHRAR